MTQCRKEALEMTALAARFTRCHLIQLHRWAKINSLMTSALFIFFLYIFSLVAFFSPRLFFSLHSSQRTLFNSCLECDSNQNTTNLQENYSISLLQLLRGRAQISNTLICPLLVFLEGCRSLYSRCQQVCRNIVYAHAVKWLLHLWVMRNNK